MDAWRLRPPGRCGGDHQLAGTAVIGARATQDLSRFDPDLRGFTISQLTEFIALAEQVGGMELDHVLRRLALLAGEADQLVARSPMGADEAPFGGPPAPASKGPLVTQGWVHVALRPTDAHRRGDPRSRRGAVRALRIRSDLRDHDRAGFATFQPLEPLARALSERGVAVERRGTVEGSQNTRQRSRASTKPWPLRLLQRRPVRRERQVIPARLHVVP